MEVETTLPFRPHGFGFDFLFSNWISLPTDAAESDTKWEVKFCSFANSGHSKWASELNQAFCGVRQCRFLC